MAKYNLKTQVGVRTPEGVTYYGPGETELPDDLAAGLGLDMEKPVADPNVPPSPGQAVGAAAVAEDYDGLTVEELRERARSRSVEVKRSGGEEGAPLKDDYVRALKRADKKAAGT